MCSMSSNGSVPKEAIRRCLKVALGSRLDEREQRKSLHSALSSLKKSTPPLSIPITNLMIRSGLVHIVHLTLEKYFDQKWWIPFDCAYWPYFHVKYNLTTGKYVYQYLKKHSRIYVEYHPMKVFRSNSYSGVQLWKSWLNGR